MAKAYYWCIIARFRALAPTFSVLLGSAERRADLGYDYLADVNSIAKTRLAEVAPGLWHARQDSRL